MPVEDASEGIRFRLDMPQEIPTMGQRRCVRKALDQAVGKIRRHPGNKMEMAVTRFKLSKSTFRGDKTGENPTDRAKLGVKRHILTDQRGTPLSVAISGANVHDMKTLEETLDSIAIKRPVPIIYYPQHLCLDKGYDYPVIERAVVEREYIPHIRHKGEDLKDAVKCHQPKRWVVERSASWINRFRKLLIRYEKKAENYLGLIQLACCLTVYRRIILG
jgi:putative transposase